MKSPPSAVSGAQRPRVSSVPPCHDSTGQEAVELAEAAGLILDPWEEFVLQESLGEDKKGHWAAFEVGLMVSRQNGKGSILEARELAGLFLLEERLIIHSAHLFDTSMEHFQRLLELIENTPEFDGRVKRVSRAHGQEGIELKGGQRIRFRTRTKGGGRGFTGDCVVFDEAMDIPESTHGAILPTLAARSIKGAPQVWYTGSAVDQWVHEHGVVFARIRERGLSGKDPALAYFEWSPPCEDPDEASDFLDDPQAWAEANPGLGIRIAEEHIARERRSMDARTFAVERLGIGDWPSTNDAADEIFDRDEWAGIKDESLDLTDAPTLALDVSPDRSSASIAASRKTAGLVPVEVVERKRGTGWLVDRVVELVKERGSKQVVLDARGPAGSLLEPLEEALAFEVTVVSTAEYVQACGAFYDAVSQKTTRHRGQPELDAAIRGATTRPLGEAWAWSRTKSSVDITPLVACTLARWGAYSHTNQEPLVAWR